jgi:fatty acid desaturase
MTTLELAIMLWTVILALGGTYLAVRYVLWPVTKWLLFAVAFILDVLILNPILRLFGRI